MRFQLDTKLIPGTILERAEYASTGLEFLNKIFYISDGVMRSQIRDISGVDGSTLQNWIKRGWVGNPQNKRYTKDQLARILIVNMMRGQLLLERIDYLLHYINGKLDDKSDDIISESVLYDYVCRIIDTFTERGAFSLAELKTVIGDAVADYVEPVEGAKTRLSKALTVILTAYFASGVSSLSNALYEEIERESK